MPDFLALQAAWENELRSVMTVKEVMALFRISDPKTVIMACTTLRLKSRKADMEVGFRGGVWLIDRNDALRLWGHRIGYDHEHP